MQKPRLSVAYILFYLLLSKDSWRIATGFVLAVILGPLITQGRNIGTAGEVMVWLMVMAIGWSIAAWPARKITAILQRAIRQASKS